MPGVGGTVKNKNHIPPLSLDYSCLLSNSVVLIALIYLIEIKRQTKPVLALQENFTTIPIQLRWFQLKLFEQLLGR